MECPLCYKQFSEKDIWDIEEGPSVPGRDFTTIYTLYNLEDVGEIPLDIVDPKIYIWTWCPSCLFEGPRALFDKHCSYPEICRIESSYYLKGSFRIESSTVNRIYFLDHNVGRYYYNLVKMAKTKFTEDLIEGLASDNKYERQFALKRYNELTGKDYKEVEKMDKILEKKVKLMEECYKETCKMLTDVILKHNLLRVKSSDATRVAIALFKAVDEQNKLKEIW